MKKKTQQINYNINQKSFYFEDYLETNIKKKKTEKSNISEDRIYILFFLFFSLISIFSIKIMAISIQEPQFKDAKKKILNFHPLRKDIVDRNGELISRNVKAFRAAVKPNLIKDKKKFKINIKINFPEISQNKLEKKFLKNKYFYLKKRLTENEKKTFWEMGEKGMEFESFQARIYPHGKLYSHVLGQIDDENYGISGVEKYFNKELIDQKKINQPLVLSLDTNIQYLIKKELENAIEDFEATGAAAILMDNKTGEIISLVSLPDYNINIRENIIDRRYTNKITKGLYELGSVFKTFTVALALEESLFDTNSNINNITKQIKCSKYIISDIHNFPKKMSVENILIQSSNIGSIQIARAIGEEKYKNFLQELNLLKAADLELEEVSKPRELKWNKCKLETVSFGHGIMTTPLQVVAAYAAITNGGYIIKPTLKKKKKPDSTLLYNKQIISNSTSIKMIKMLRKVVTDKKGTASLANIYGYNVGGKTGTAQNYVKKDENINTFISIFPTQKPKYVMLVMLNNPKPAPHIIYNYRGNKITNINRNEAGWNSVYVSGKIIKKIGPILAINNNEVHNNHVVKKLN